MCMFACGHAHVSPLFFFNKLSRISLISAFALKQMLYDTH